MKNLLRLMFLCCLFAATTGCGPSGTTVIEPEEIPPLPSVNDGSRSGAGAGGGDAGGVGQATPDPA